MKFVRSFYHYTLAWLASVMCGNPSREIFVLGITGTKGKSSVVELVGTILGAAGKKVALLSSVRTKYGDEIRTNTSGMTMPGRFAVQRFLREAVEKGCSYAVIEVTSQGVVQHRHRFIDFDAAMLTNLEPEHIEAHGSFENYRAAKIGFFEYVARRSKKSRKYFFINENAKSSALFCEAADDAGEIIMYGGREISAIKTKSDITHFNAENIAAAIAFARSQGVPWDTLQHAIDNFKGVPGRFEFVQQAPFAVIVDYAHTPDSLEKVYRSVREILNKKNAKPKGRIIAVLGGAGGGRDIWKRPVMGGIAAKYCDTVILSNEDPFDEDPDAIIGQIAAGIPATEREKIFRIPDRTEAIRKAIRLAKKGDAVVLTGKGSELSIRIAGGKKIPWNERGVAEQVLAGERMAG